MGITATARQTEQTNKQNPQILRADYPELTVRDGVAEGETNLKIELTTNRNCITNARLSWQKYAHN